MRAHNKGCIVRVVLVSFVLIFTCLPSAIAQEMSIKGKWGVGLRAGPAVLTQDIASGDKGDTGPIVSGNIIYGYDETLSLGFNIEWETHAVDELGVNLGDATTISLLPFAEVRPVRFGALSPYASFGMGVNLNLFDVSDILKSIGFDLKPENTLALKISAGADYFVTPNLALNTEFGWKFNSGKADGCIGGTCVRDDWKFSVFSLLLGLRYYF